MIRALVLAIGILLPSSVNAEVESYFPFYYGRSSAFKEYLNSLGKQSNGSTYEFIDVRSCQANDMQNTQYYECLSADYNQTNARGTRTCVDHVITFTVYKHNRHTEFNMRDKVGVASHCGKYRQVSSYKTPTTASEPETKGITLNPSKDLMIGGGFLLFAAGFGTGLVVSALGKRRTEITKTEKGDGEDADK